MHDIPVVAYERVGPLRFGMTYEKALEVGSRTYGEPTKTVPGRYCAFGDGRARAHFDPWGRLAMVDLVGPVPAAADGGVPAFGTAFPDPRTGVVAYSGDEGRGAPCRLVGAFPFSSAEALDLWRHRGEVAAACRTERQGLQMEGVEVDFGAGEDELGAFGLCLLCAEVADGVGNGLLLRFARTAGLCFEDGTGDVRGAQVAVLESLALKLDGGEMERVLAEAQRVRRGIERTYGAMLPRPSLLRAKEAAMLKGPAGEIVDGASFRREAGGLSFGAGLLKGVREDELEGWGRRLAARGVATAPEMDVFAYDWRGRAYGTVRGEVVVAGPRGAVAGTGCSFGQFMGPDPGLSRLLLPEAVPYRQWILGFGEVYCDEAAADGVGPVSLDEAWGLR